MDAIEFVETWEKAEREADRKADLLFAGQENPPAAELEIIFDFSLSFTDKMAKLQVLRGESVKPQSFENRLNAGDFLRVRSLGIVLTGSNDEDEIEYRRR